jgi:hypothetical protein
MLNAMMKEQEKKIIPREQQKSGTKIDGKECIALFLAESIGVSCIDGKIDFSKNEELLEILNNEFSNG